MDDIGRDLNQEDVESNFDEIVSLREVDPGRELSRYLPLCDPWGQRLASLKIPPDAGRQRLCLCRRMCGVVLPNLALEIN